MPAITEPTTLATDYLIMLLSAGLAVTLQRRSRAAAHWVVGFAVTAFAAFAGGSAHGFQLFFGERGLKLLWGVTIASLAASALLLIAAGIRSAMRPGTDSPEARAAGLSWLKWAVAITLMGLLVLLAKISFHQHFNQNDLYHLVQMAGLYCLYRGARLLHPRS